MSKTNWHEASGKSISADEWFIKFRDDIPICKVCNSSLTFVATARNQRTTHFRHPDNSNCPTVKFNSKLYENFRPKEKDYQNARKLKEWVIDNPYLLFRQMWKILGGSIRYSEFTDILTAANKRQIWYYVGLEVEMLPYTLLVNYGLFPKLKDRTGREREMYMAFESNLSSYEEIWNKPSSEAKYIFRIYRDTSSTNEYELVRIGDIMLPENLTTPDFMDYYLKKQI